MNKMAQSNPHFTSHGAWLAWVTMEAWEIHPPYPILTDPCLLDVTRPHKPTQ